MRFGPPRNERPALGSNRSAYGYWLLALEVVGSPDEEYGLRMAAGASARDAGLLEAAPSHFERAIELASAAGDDPGRRRAIAFLGEILTEGHLERGMKLVSMALDEPGLTPDDEGYLELAAINAKFLMRIGESQPSIDMADSALAAGAARLDDAATLELLITRGTALANIHRLLEAVTTLTGARILADRLGLTEAFMRASINLSYAYEPDDPRAGLEISLDGLARARRYGQRHSIRYLLGNSCEGALQIGDWDWILQQVRDELRDELEAPDQIFFGGFEVRIQAARGEDVSARLRELQDLAAPFDDDQYISLVEESREAVGLAIGQLQAVVDLCRARLTIQDHWPADAIYGARAATWLGDAQTVAEMIDAWRTSRRGRQTAALETTMHAGLAALEGRHDDARATYAKAQREFRDLGLIVPLAMCQLDLVIVGAMEPAERQRAADEARATFERLGMRPFLERLERALATPPVRATDRTSHAADAEVGRPA